MSQLLTKLTDKINLWRAEINELVTNYGSVEMSAVTVSQAYGGMRDVRSLICDTSRVPKEEGLIIRERRLKDVAHLTPEEIFYLLLTGDLPNENELSDFAADIRSRKNVPSYVWDVLKAMPKDSHPMAMLNTAILVMQKESVFAKKYEEGLKKDQYWIYTLEDALNIVAKVPAIAAAVYRLKFADGNIIQPDPSMDITGDYVHMLGIENKDNKFYELMKLYLVLHCDHEGGNVSAFTTATVNSALSDLYYSVSAGLNGLAGPLHGLASQESVNWILETNEKLGGDPTPEQLTQFVWDTINSGKVVPGYGHAVLRITDPRFQIFLDFGRKNCPDAPAFKTVSHLFDIVPNVLKQIEKIKNPWPNVDGASGSLLYSYGLTKLEYYTVVFAVSRVLGLTSQAVWNRAVGMPITRPKSVTTHWVKDFVKNK